MTTPTLYTQLVSTNGAVSLMRTDFPGLPTFAVLTADGELLDTFTNKAEADEFYTDTQNRVRAGLQWPDPDAPACSDIHPLVLIKYAVAHKATADKTDLEFDGLDNFFN